MDAADTARKVQVYTNYEDYAEYADGGGAAASGSAANHITIDPHNPMHQARMNPMTITQMFPVTGSRTTRSGLTVNSQMARKIFERLTTGNFMHPDPDDGKIMQSLEEKILPVYRMPFVSDPESDFIFNEVGFGKHDIGDHMYDLGKDERIQIRNEIASALTTQRHRLLDVPLVFLVITNIPHASIYILVGGKLYSFGYGYYGDSGPDGRPLEVMPGAIYSIDILMGDNNEARIAWVGILDQATLDRMNAKFASVTQIIFSVTRNKDGESIVSKQSYLLIPDQYSGTLAETQPAYYDCLKWAMEVLGILRPNYGDVLRAQIDEPYISRLIQCMYDSDTRGFLQTLRIANDKVYTPEQIRQFDEKYGTTTESAYFAEKWKQSTPAAFRGGRRIKKFRSCNKGTRKCKRQTRNNKPRNNKTKKTRNNKTRMSRKMKK